MSYTLYPIRLTREVLFRLLNYFNNIVSDSGGNGGSREGVSKDFVDVERVEGLGLDLMSSSSEDIHGAASEIDSGDALKPLDWLEIFGNSIASTDENLSASFYDVSLSPLVDNQNMQRLELPNHLGHVVVVEEAAVQEQRSYSRRRDLFEDEGECHEACTTTLSEALSASKAENLNLVQHTDPKLKEFNDAIELGLAALLGSGIDDELPESTGLDMMTLLSEFPM
jgi:hypothetical protein